MLDKGSGNTEQKNSRSVWVWINVILNVKKEGEEDIKDGFKILLEEEGAIYWDGKHWRRIGFFSMKDLS
jgi:hypothetical protein